jgi:hypothetical protein
LSEDAVKERRPRWLGRRRLYAGGALMVLAPIGVSGCASDKGGKDAIAIAPADVVADAPDGFGADPIAIAPYDPGVLDSPDLPPIAIAPADFGADPGEDVPPIAIAPYDMFAGDPGEDVPPIAIAPYDPGIADPGEDVPPIAIAPFDAGQPASCKTDADCAQDRFCRQTVISVVPVECVDAPDGVCECMPVACDVADPVCPEGSTCKEADGAATCVRDVATPEPGGYMAECLADADCLQEYFCEQTMFCIAPGIAQPFALPVSCNAKNCVPRTCAETSACPEGSTCVPLEFGGKTLCVRDVGLIPGGFAGACLADNSKKCISDLYFCYQPMCIVACPSSCMPAGCKTDADCKDGQTCADTGVGMVCTR